MEKLGIFVWLKGVGVRTVLKENYFVHHYKFKDDYGWLANDKHQKIAPIDLGVWNDDSRD